MMRYSISELRLFDVMEDFLRDQKVVVMDPELVKSTKFYKGNRGYGSGLDDYRYTVTDYRNRKGELLFHEFSDNHPTSDVKWAVDIRFEPLVDFFGDELFEKFINSYYGLDISNAGPFSASWEMYDL